MAFMDTVSLSAPKSQAMLSQRELAATLNPEKDPALLNLMCGYAELNHYAKSLEKGLPFYFEPIVRDGKLLLKPQSAAGDVGQDPEMNAVAFYQPEVYLEDLKQPYLSQMSTAILKLRAMRQDPEFWALAKWYAFDGDPGPGGASASAIDRETEYLREVSGAPGIPRPRRTREARGFSLDAARRRPAALRPTEVHHFAAIMSGIMMVAVGLNLFLGPIGIYAAYAASPWAVAAAGQEVAVGWHAIGTQDADVLVSDEAIASYDFENQRESGATSTFAHAHEWARALTQSDGAFVPRLVAPFTLVLAIVDDVVGGIMGLFGRLVAAIARRLPVDAEMLRTFEQKAARIQQILSDPVAAVPPAASTFWQRHWSQARVGLGAVWRNSNSRQAALELSARMELAAAA